jgi:hypothetical protein
MPCGVLTGRLVLPGTVSAGAIRDARLYLYCILVRSPFVLIHDRRLGTPGVLAAMQVQILANTRQDGN